MKIQLLLIAMTNITNLKEKFSGTIVTADSANYDTARKTFTASGAPLAIVFPETTDDITAAITFARDNNLLLSVRSGGHNGLDFGTNNKGIVVDMSSFSQVSVIDKEQGIVRIGAGVHWGAAAEALAPYGLAVSAGDTASVGVGGLTLGGGIGIMARKYGLAIDQLIGAELVTADGHVLHLSDTENADLFWAIRGGGGNFGVITYFEFAAHHLASVSFGTIVYQLDSIKTLVANWRDATRMSGVDVTTTLVVMPAFGDTPPSAQLYFCYAGEDDAGANEALRPFLSIAPVVKQNVSRMSYRQALQDAHPPTGVVGIVKNGVIRELDDDFVAMIDAAYTGVAGRMMFLRSLGGKIDEIANDATAFASRDCEALLVTAAFLPQTITEKERSTAMDFFTPIAEKCVGAYSNFFTTYNDADFARIFPPATLARLKELKHQYDPDNIFSRNLPLV